VKVVRTEQHVLLGQRGPVDPPGRGVNLFPQGEPINRVQEKPRHSLHPLHVSPPEDVQVNGQQASEARQTVVGIRAAVVAVQEYAQEARDLHLHHHRVGEVESDGINHKTHRLQLPVRHRAILAAHRDAVVVDRRTHHLLRHRRVPEVRHQPILGGAALSVETNDISRGNS
jgi:hypothetical protein